MRDFSTAVFDGVSDEVLEYLGQLCGVGPDGWQRIVGHDRADSPQSLLVGLRALPSIRFHSEISWSAFPFVPARE